MEAIVAMNEYGYIGLDGKLPWNCKEDLQHFKKMTMGKTLLVGRTTIESMPELKGRKVIVVGTGYNTLEEALKNDIDFVIGGKRMYESVKHLITFLHVSEISNRVIGDTRMPELNIYDNRIQVRIYRFKED